jgi:hypothetical protein
MQIKNRKTNFIPYKKYNDKHVVIMFDFKPVLKEGKETPLATWEEYRFNYVPTIDDIKKVVLNYYNKQIDNEITSGLVWNGMKIWLSSENQFNYKAAYDLAIQTNGSTLPIVFKFGDEQNTVYHEFRDIEELTDFYMSSIKHIQNTLEKGWRMKDNIDWKIFQ